MRVMDEAVKEELAKRLHKIEEHLSGDVAFFYGYIDTGLIKPFRDFIEKMAADANAKKRLLFFVNTPGGSAEAVEKMVEIIRQHYSQVFFVVPDVAYSAGTILCMAGDRIYMDYASALGPIDPQVHNGKEWVPARGYLDKVEAFLEKSRKGILTNAEFLMLQNQDLAVLARYEQTCDLTVTLLKEWLVKYKFKNWHVHHTDPKKKGQKVTKAEKQERAEEIAKLLGSNKVWHSHGRMIGPDTLRRVLRLKIDDYSRDVRLQPMIRSYNDLLTDYIVRNQIPAFLHSRTFF